MGIVGEKPTPSVGQVTEKEKKRLNELARKHQDRVNDPEKFFRRVKSVYDAQKVRPRSSTIVLLPMLPEISRGNLTVQMHRGDETIKAYMRNSYHLVIGIDETSDEIKNLGIQVGQGVQVQDFPFPFHLPLSLSKVDFELEGVELYGIKAFDVLAITDGLRLQKS